MQGGGQARERLELFGERLNDTFPNLYDALVYERKFKGEYLERQIYERILTSEPSIVKLIENMSGGRAKASPQTNLEVSGQRHFLKRYSARAC